MPSAGKSRLPADVTSCHEMINGLLQTLSKRDQRIDQLEEIVDQLIRQRYGRKSERYDAQQLALFTTAQVDDSAEAEQPEEETTTSSKKPPRGGTGRRQLDANTRREERIHRLREDQKECPKCGSSLAIVLVKGCLRWAYRPAEIYGIQHLLEKGFCNCCYEHVQLSDAPPEMIAKGAADASLLAHLTTSKQGDHLGWLQFLGQGRLLFG